MAALLQQLEEMLAPWDGASDCVEPLRSDEGPSVSPFGVPLLHSSDGKLPGSYIHLDPSIPELAVAQDTPGGLPDSPCGGPSITSSRQAATKVEIARGVLALFTSNAGVYRPVLQKVLRFLFGYVDFLVERHADLMYEGCSRAAPPLACADDLHHLDADQQEEVVNAYQNVRAVEAKMARLVDDAAAQRGRFKAQIEQHQQRIHTLEGLLQHQIELTHMLYGPGHEAGSFLKPPPPGGEAKDAAYVRRLIAQAEREKAFEELTQKYTEVTRDRDALNQKVESLLSLSSQYARQALELSARLSVLHEHNIALSADIQLYKRDIVKEQQKSDRLGRDLTATHNMLLTLLDARYQVMLLSAAYVGGCGMHPGQPNPSVLLSAGDASHPDDQGVDAGQRSPKRASRVGTVPLSEAAFSCHSPTEMHGSTNAIGFGGGVHGSPTVWKANTAAHVHSKTPGKVKRCLAVMQNDVLRSKLKAILAIDAAQGSISKELMLDALNQRSELPLADTLVSAEDASTDKQCAGANVIVEHERELPDYTTHLWAPTLGQSPAVPRHLRSRGNVPALVFHPIVAECFVHELLTQWKDYIAYKRQELIDMEYEAAGGAPAAETSPLHRKRKPMHVPLDEFVELFVNVVWLHRSTRLVPLLSEEVRQKVEEVAMAEECARSEWRTQALAGGTVPEGPQGSTLDSNRVLLQLHGTLYTKHTPERVVQLDEEGLRLTYGLDVASRSSSAGFLAYAYGLVSRKEVGEAIFDVMQSDRRTFLRMCKAVDQERLMSQDMQRKQERRELIWRRAQANVVKLVDDEGDPCTSDEVMEGDDKGVCEVIPLSGCIPVVQLARLLMAMYPQYPVSRIEHLVIAATQDGTDSEACPVMVYYGVLLPERLLPGTASSCVQSADFWRAGAFATRFYTFICDDAQEAFQLVEDSLHRFCRTAQLATTSGNSTAEPLSMGATVASVSQLGTLGFHAVPPTDLRRWGPALRAVLARLPLSQGACMSNLTHRTTDATGTAVECEEDGSSCQQSHISIPVADVMPFLRRQLVLRRGPHVPDLQGSTSNGVLLGPHGDAGEVGSSNGICVQGDVFSAEPSPSWSDGQLAYLDTLQRRWNRYAGNAVPLVTDAASFLSMIRQIDTRREWVWDTAGLADNDDVLRYADAEEAPSGSDIDDEAK